MAIYIRRGLDSSLAKQVAVQPMAPDALAAHACDELGVPGTLRARPLQAALTSASSLAIGAVMPPVVVALVSESNLIRAVSGTSLVFLALLGGLAAHICSANIVTGITRITFWSALAVGVTASIGALIGAAA